MSQTSNEQVAQEATNAQSVSPESTQELLDQLLKPEVQHSLTVLINHLPKITEMVNALSGAYDLAQSVAKDPVFVNDMKHGISEFATPVIAKAKGVASAAMEANERAQADTSTIGVFGLLKILKDPNVQKTLRFSQAFLDTLNDRQKLR
ncbi:uncharacterized protein YjgD (DUF1641 family) [Paenibacillus shirakamiensis]|uniref:Uncharacterized protein YjgD (DUF1641 family) n=1 Tax=Paenibacillus shirakamiensis TaxID=1265935 RepID=A0ABS4JJQ4_9BACL|nr:DUF1641 domain-containing protein [Paenibacillus shirakamiensis]MBP2001937.1 uncharacterized protein YjgD (DUF1641 family) [Paenibacillus shirakamiensis]